jgi:hypothetical protein
MEMVKTDSLQGPESTCPVVMTISVLPAEPTNDGLAVPGCRASLSDWKLPGWDMSIYPVLG